ncbi:hypothetical protein [Aurantimonas sp. VKM B-3413]|uniref:hypothetical protein n=1 Tax=Aurantimonas sp. VKM B-3413 TaxID=2779401 RepID=UPI001E3041EE|nr:hypothetical protein [Aurantimonas sp. VKM B-3413]MCB8838012.1 hypothetical protein [Aurantimonas sp. VKM B-3413]
MTDFFDWLTASDYGLGTDRLADTFKLSHQEMRKTADALAPAYALAMQRMMFDPAAWSEVSRRFLPFAADSAPTAGQDIAQSPAARDLSSALFGSQEIISTVARQVSLISGVTPDTVEKLMRNLSVMAIETMVKMMLANMARQQPKGFAEGNMPVAMAEMMRRSANAMEALGRPSDAPAPRPQAGMPQMPGTEYLQKLFSDALNGNLPWLPPSSVSPQAPANPKPSTSTRQSPAMPGFPPFDEMAHAFLRGWHGSGEAERGEAKPAAGPDAAGTGPSAASSADQAPETSAKDTAPSADPASLAQAGFDLQQEYARQMMAIFGRQPTGDKETDAT